MKTISSFVISLFLVLVPVLQATDNYEYKKDEYLVISNGTSPDKKWAIKAHGDGVDGYENFHLYLVDAASGKTVGPLTEVVDNLDTGAGSFAALWSKDSKTVTIVYRVSRHEPLQSMTYTLVQGRALPQTKAPVGVTEKSLQDHWTRHSSGYFNPDGSRKEQ